MSTSPIAPSPLPPWHRPVLTPQTQVLTGTGAILLNTDVTYLDKAMTDGEVIEVTIPDGNAKRDGKRIYIPGATVLGTASFRVTGNFTGFTSLLFNAVGFSAVLEWDGARWHMVGGNALQEQA